MPITNEVVSSNPTHGEVYSIQHYVIKFISDLPSRWFSQGTPVSFTNKTDCHDITEILKYKFTGPLQQFRVHNILHAHLWEENTILFQSISLF